MYYFASNLTLMEADQLQLASLSSARSILKCENTYQIKGLFNFPVTYMAIKMQHADHKSGDDPYLMECEFILQNSEQFYSNFWGHVNYVLSRHKSFSQLAQINEIHGT